MLERTAVGEGPRARIEEMDFKPGRLFPALMCALVAAVFGTFGTIFAVNIYRELRAPTTPLDTFGWLFGGAITYGLALLLLHVITAQWRISFAEDGVRVRGLFGRRFVPWAAVRSAHAASYKGNVTLTLRTGRLAGVGIPLNAYGRPASLFAEVSKRLSVPVHISPAVAATLRDD